VRYKWEIGCWKLGLANSLLVGAALAFSGEGALAQIVGDATLPVNSVVTPQGNTITITGGTVKGGNLFHSFKEFSVLPGSTAHFDNAPVIQNIFTRVTGGGMSKIEGTLKANGAANLFLINPSGIIFGPNAKLDIGGSFLASTASAVKFADGTEFSATAPQTAPLLTVSVPVGLQFGQMPGRIAVRGLAANSRAPKQDMPKARIDERSVPIPPENIANQIIGSIESLGTNILQNSSGGLMVQPGKTLALAGGEIVLEGAQLRSPQGRIELGSVAGAGLVSLTPAAQGLALGYEGFHKFQDISLSGGANVDASGSGGGHIEVRGAGVTLAEGSSIFAATLGNLDGGEISIKAEQLNIQGGSLVGAIATKDSWGKSGDVLLDIERLTVSNSAVFSVSLGQANAGNLTVKVPGTVELIGALPYDLLPGGMNAATGGKGAGGTLTIETRQLIVWDGAQVSATTGGVGQAGNVVVRAKESIELSGESAYRQFSSGIFAPSYGTGKAGNVQIETGRLIVRDGASVATSTRRGVGGSVFVNASESIELSGTTVDGRFESSLAALAIGIAGENAGELQGGDVRIETSRLMVRDGAQISASGFGSGQGGSVEVTAKESIELMGTSADGRYKSGLLAANFFPNAFKEDRVRLAGNLRIATGELTVRDGAEGTVRGEGLGAAGNLSVMARSIRLDSGAITATTEAGNSGNIQLQAENLQLRHNSSVTTSATGTATGGNIEIDTGVIAALENSDIEANALGGPGGQVQISTQGIFRQGIFGTEVRRESSNLTSDITATSNLGPQFDGAVDIKTPDVDPSRGLVPLPQNFVDVAGLIDRRCSAGNPPGRNFTITGRGGKPPSPSDPLTSNAGWVDSPPSTAPAENSAGSAIAAPPASPPADQLVEAQGWAINANGQVELVAEAPTVTPYSSWFTPAPCNGHSDTVEK
jgi:filamentous hemagglutinin family protein